MCDPCQHKPVPLPPHNHAQNTAWGQPKRPKGETGQAACSPLPRPLRSSSRRPCTGRRPRPTTLPPPSLASSSPSVREGPAGCFHHCFSGSVCIALCCVCRLSLLWSENGFDWKSPNCTSLAPATGCPRGLSGPTSPRLPSAAAPGVPPRLPPEPQPGSRRPGPSGPAHPSRVVTARLGAPRSHCRDPHDELPAAALGAPRFVRPQVTQHVQDGVSTVVIGQGA